MAMRPALAYSLARFGLFLAALLLLYLIGARGLLLVALALLVSGIISFVVLSRQRDAMSSSLSTRLRGMRARVAEFGGRLDEGAKAEDED
jgi:Mn2+/Fe2+ NRAMP family transporter